MNQFSSKQAAKQKGELYEVTSLHEFPHRQPFKLIITRAIRSLAASRDRAASTARTDANVLMQISGIMPARIRRACTPRTGRIATIEHDSGPVICRRESN